MSILRLEYRDGCGLSFRPRYVMKQSMEKIDPQRDHEQLKQFKLGEPVTFNGKPYKVQRRTTLASGEPALVLQSEKEQFVISADELLAGVQPAK